MHSALPLVVDDDSGAYLTHCVYGYSGSCLPSLVACACTLRVSKDRSVGAEPMRIMLWVHVVQRS